MIRYPLYRTLGGFLGRSGQVRKISSPPGSDPWTVQPVVSRYTDWAIPAQNAKQGNMYPVKGGEGVGWEGSNLKINISRKSWWFLNVKACCTVLPSWLEVFMLTHTCIYIYIHICIFIVTFRRHTSFFAFVYYPIGLVYYAKRLNSYDAEDDFEWPKFHKRNSVLQSCRNPEAKCPWRIWETWTWTWTWTKEQNGDEIEVVWGHLL